MELALNSSEHMYQLLKAEILSLKIKPGQPMPEKELCERFGVSRTPIRSVLQRLRDAGLVTIVPYKTTTASLLNYDETVQLIYMRTAVESMVLRDFLESYTLSQLEKVRYIIRKQSVLLQEEYVPEQFYMLDSQLHAVWFHAMQKDGLWRAIQKAQSNYTRFRILDYVSESTFKDLIEEHEQLFALIEARDAAAIEPFMKKHLYGGIERLGDRLTTEFADYFMQQPNTTKKGEQYYGNESI